DEDVSGFGQDIAGGLLLKVSRNGTPYRLASFSHPETRPERWHATLRTRTWLARSSGMAPCISHNARCPALWRGRDSRPERMASARSVRVASDPPATSALVSPVICSASTGSGL